MSPYPANRLKPIKIISVSVGHYHHLTSRGRLDDGCTRSDDGQKQGENEQCAISVKQNTVRMAKGKICAESIKCAADLTGIIHILDFCHSSDIL
jgi:hypothetical protein